jgi:hypothetical protein
MSKVTETNFPKAMGNVEYNQYWALENEVASGFNRLKAKLFNLIEATISEEVQQKAVKGLIKGFSNDEYKICIENMRYSARIAGYIEKEEIEVPQSAEPLENRTF